MRLMLISATVDLGIGPAAASDAHCMARVLTDVAALEAPEQVKSKKNGDFGPVERIKVSRKSGRMYFCAHESYCYDSNAFQIIASCRIKRDTEMTDPNFFVYFTR